MQIRLKHINPNTKFAWNSTNLLRPPRNLPEHWLWCGQALLSQRSQFASEFPQIATILRFAFWGLFISKD